MCPKEIYILASGLILMVQAKALLNFKIELLFEHLSWPFNFKNKIWSEIGAALLVSLK